MLHMQWSIGVRQFYVAGTEIGGEGNGEPVVCGNAAIRILWASIRSKNERPHSGQGGLGSRGRSTSPWTTAALIAFQLRFPNHWIDLVPLIGWYALAGVLVKLPLIVGFGLYRQVWRRVTVEDLCRLALVIAVGSAAMFAAGSMWYRAGSAFPRTVPIIEGLTALLAMVAVRLGVRYRESRRRRRLNSMLGESARHLLLVGAGEAGTEVGWEIRRRPESGFTVVGFLDDDPAKTQLSIAGKKVLERVADLPRVVRDHEIQKVFITLPSAGGRTTRRIVELARSADVDCRILPGITQVLTGEATLAGIRALQVEDLLCRDRSSWLCQPPTSTIGPC